MLFELAERMEQSFEEMVRDRDGHAESAAMIALASSMGTLPGRKTVVLFSEGLSIPAAVVAKFEAVIDTANRGNVTFYAMDAKGLKVHSAQAATAWESWRCAASATTIRPWSLRTTRDGPGRPTSSATSSCSR